MSEHMMAFLEELDREIGWEWHWEKRHRRWTWGVTWAGWISRVLILALTTYQLSTFGKNLVELWVAFSLAILGVLNIGLPLLAVSFRFQQRQEVHDRNARAYSVIKIELLSGQIDLNEAVNRFKAIREQPTEAIIRKTP